VLVVGKERDNFPLLSEPLKTVVSKREIEKFIIRQPPMGENHDYDSENSWISDGLPSSSRRRRRGGGRWEVREWREK